MLELALAAPIGTLSRLMRIFSPTGNPPTNLHVNQLGTRNSELRTQSKLRHGYRRPQGVVCAVGMVLSAADVSEQGAGGVG